MDLKKYGGGGGGGGGLWTNERHVSYLNWMEASFVRSLFANDISSTVTYSSYAPRHRHLPDNLQSTCDSKPSRNQRQEASDTINTANNGRKSGKKTRRRCSGPYDAAQDQVVPQFGKSKADKEEESHDYH